MVCLCFVVNILNNINVSMGGEKKMPATIKKRPVFFLVMGIIFSVYIGVELVILIYSKPSFFNIPSEGIVLTEILSYIFLLSIGVAYWIFSFISIFIEYKTFLIIMGMFHCLMNIRAFSGVDVSIVSIMQYIAFGASIAYLIIACLYKEFKVK